MKSIRGIPIISSTVEATCDGRTLIWLHDQEIQVAQGRWNRWDTVVSDTNAMEKWGKEVDFDFVLLMDSNFNKETLAKYSGKISNIFISSEARKACSEQYWAHLKTNIVMIQQFIQKYSHLPRIESIADFIAGYALLFHYNKISGIRVEDLNNEMRGQLQKVDCKIVDDVPPEIWFITQYFIHKNSKRAREFRRCLMFNCSCKYIDKILLLNETDLSSSFNGFRNNEKIRQEVIGERLKYSHLLKATIEIVPENCIVVYANADIFLNDTIKEVFSVDMHNKMFALLRWDTDDQVSEKKLFGPRPDSQDTWIVWSTSIQERVRKGQWKMEQFDYELGRAGCDNRFTSDMFSNRFLISNPCNSIETLHLHQTQVRDYNPYELVTSKFYLHLSPCNLMNIIKKKTPDGAPIQNIRTKEFPITIRCPNKKNGVTWCAMISRLKRFEWEHEMEKKFGGSEIKIWSIPEAFVGPWGFIYDYKNVYLGNDIQTFISRGDIEFTIEYTQTTSTVENFAVVPIMKKEWMRNYDLYLLNVFSKMYRILKTYNYSFWLPEEFQQRINELKISQKLNSIPWNDQTQIYSKEIVCMMPEVLEICADDIDNLRSMIDWKEQGERKCCILRDDVICTADFVAKIKELLGDKWVVDEVDADREPGYEKILGSSLCFFFGGPKCEKTWAKLWALPRSSHVVEIQNELKTDGEFQYLAGAADLKSWIITVYKGSADDMRKQALDHIRGAAANLIRKFENNGDTE